MFILIRIFLSLNSFHSILDKMFKSYCSSFVNFTHGARKRGQGTRTFTEIYAREVHLTDKSETGFSFVPGSEEWSAWLLGADMPYP